MMVFVHGGRGDSIAQKIPLGILPLKPGARNILMLDAIAQGGVIYETETKVWLSYVGGKAVDSTVNS